MLRTVRGVEAGDRRNVGRWRWVNRHTPLKLADGFITKGVQVGSNDGSEHDGRKRPGSG